VPDPTEINRPVQLLVEGRDALVFFSAFLRYLGITAIQLQNFGGINELGPFLKALRDSPGFLERVGCLGVIRDAESDPGAAFQSVCSALRNAGLPVPPRPRTRAGADPSIAVLILPDEGTDGMLETLCLRAVAEDPARPCVDDYFTCLSETLTALPRNLHKAKIHAFLASRPKSDLQLGQAASAGYFDWANPAFGEVRQFLMDLLPTT
jgi:hypothetical protein